MVVALGTGLVYTAPRIPVDAAFDSQSEYLTRDLDIYAVCQAVNSTLPANARVMMVGDTRGFYLDRDYLWDWGNHDLIPPSQQDRPEALYAALRRLGVTHLLVSPAVSRSIASPQAPVDQALHALVTEGALRQVIDPSTGHGFSVLALSR
jgi:hypothetical protein